VGVQRTANFFHVRKWTGGFFTYHDFLTITSLSRIISRELYLFIYPRGPFRTADDRLRRPTRDALRSVADVLLR
jgi:hypothetical protein